MTDILSNELVRCPTCKNDDCVESERIDRCSACGWMQVVPLDNPDRFQKKERKCVDPWCPFLGQLHPEHKPTPEPEKSTLQAKECCGGYAGRGKPKDEVEDREIEAKIHEIGALYYRIFTKQYWISVGDFEYQLRELVALARKT